MSNERSFVRRGHRASTMQVIAREAGHTGEGNVAALIAGSACTRATGPVLAAQRQ